MENKYVKLNYVEDNKIVEIEVNNVLGVKNVYSVKFPSIEKFNKMWYSKGFSFHNVKSKAIIHEEDDIVYLRMVCTPHDENKPALIKFRFDYTNQCLAYDVYSQLSLQALRFQDKAERQIMYQQVHNFT